MRSTYAFALCALAAFAALVMVDVRRAEAQAVPSLPFAPSQGGGAGGGAGGLGSDGSGTAGEVAVWGGATTLTGDSALQWDGTNDRLGVGTSSPDYAIDVDTSVNSATRISIDNASAGGAAQCLIEAINNVSNGLQLQEFSSGYATTGARRANSSFIHGNNSTPGQGGTLELLASGDNANPGGVAGSIGLWTYFGGVGSPETERVRVKYTETVVNDGSENDYDFRVEGASSDNLLLVDGSADDVIVCDDGASTCLFRVETDTVSDGFVVDGAGEHIRAGVPLYLANGSAAAPSATYTSDSNTGRYLDSSGTMIDVGNALPLWKLIESSGGRVVGGYDGDTAVSYLDLPRSVDAAPPTTATCTIAIAGRVTYLDDTNDSKASTLCICASDNAETYEWTRVNLSTWTVTRGATCSAGS